MMRKQDPENTFLLDPTGKDLDLVARKVSALFTDYDGQVADMKGPWNQKI